MVPMLSGIAGFYIIKMFMFGCMMEGRCLIWMAVPWFLLFHIHLFDLVACMFTHEWGSNDPDGCFVFMTVVLIVCLAIDFAVLKKICMQQAEAAVCCENGECADCYMCCMCKKMCGGCDKKMGGQNQGGEIVKGM